MAVTSGCAALTQIVFWLATGV
ncbi:hypothetical protein PSCLAVI8L_250028 [Pseudoclavibacter sp. 8L]|nr:hypothetical protein PSCLAVI8L_250028 [Pseudoclavibacter sp. 8L]